MSLLKNDNIVKYLGCERKNDKIFIFLEFMSGGSIESILKEFGKLNEKIVQKFTKKICKGLEFLHDNSIIHRDIKPGFKKFKFKFKFKKNLKKGNILLNENGNVFLADFGNSRKINQSNLLQKKSLTGTPNYMAPEVIKGKLNYFKKNYN
jgi:serine/threonine protein kinase